MTPAAIPAIETPSWTVHLGDCLTALRKMPAESLHCCVTSPPYFALRDYAIEPSIWGGKQGCSHVFGDELRRTSKSRNGSTGKSSSPDARDAAAGNVCIHCGAWRGALGLEPSPDLFIDHIVEVFREVRRVLHSSGTLWLNIGDSYCSDGGAGGAMASSNFGSPARAEMPRPEASNPEAYGRWLKTWRVHTSRAGTNPRGAPERIEPAPIVDLKPKDLLMMPARVALALQEDGWYLRQQIPWIKNNCMPESAADRPTSAIEYIYLFSKSAEYFYDREAVRIASSLNSHARGNGVNPKAMGPNSRMRSDKDPVHQTVAKIRAKQNRSFSAAVASIVPTRARRNSDWFAESFKGLLTDSAGDPLAMLVNPQPFSIEMCRKCEAIYAQKEFRKLLQREDRQRVCVCGETAWVSHFATFPEAMVTPCVLAGTSERGCCPNCGAPWRRITEKPNLGDWHPNQAGKHEPGAVNGTAKWAKESPQSAGSRIIANFTAARAAGKRARDAAERAGDKVNSSSLLPSHDVPFPAPATLGWEASCSHPLFPADPVPAVVLDPFSGSGRTGLAAVKLGRDYVGLEANPYYLKMANWQYEQWLKSQEKVQEVAI